MLAVSLRFLFHAADPGDADHNFQGLLILSHIHRANAFQPVVCSQTLVPTFAMHIALVLAWDCPAAAFLLWKQHWATRGKQFIPHEGKSKTDHPEKHIIDIKRAKPSSAKQCSYFLVTCIEDTPTIKVG